FDGEGGVTAQDTSQTAADTTVVIGRRTGTGTYTVDSNCTGSAEIGGDFSGLSFYFAIVSPGGSVSVLPRSPSAHAGLHSPDDRYAQTTDRNLRLVFRRPEALSKRLPPEPDEPGHE